LHKNFVADFLQAKCNFYTENSRFGFLSPIWGFRGNVRYSSSAHWKERSGLPISVNWTLFARCYGWGATSENRFKIGVVAPTGL